MKKSTRYSRLPGNGRLALCSSTRVNMIHSGRQWPPLRPGSAVSRKRSGNSPVKRSATKDATFVLAKYPDSPILLTDSAIDSYGGA